MGKTGRKNQWSQEKRDAAAERMRERNADPAFKAKLSEAMRERHADPAFKAKLSEAMRERNADPAFKAKMKELHADPAFKAKMSERLRELHADPAFKAKMKELHADPAFNPLAALTREQRENYDILKIKGGYSREAALALVLSAQPAKGDANVPS